MIHTTMWPKVTVSLIKAFFALQQKFMQLRAFESNIPLRYFYFKLLGYFVQRINTICVFVEDIIGNSCEILK